MAQLYHSAVKLGINARKAFEEAADPAEPGVVRTELKGFPLRRPGDQDPRVFFLTEETAEDGFRYRQVRR
jgi:hypothetical protein